MSPRGPSEAAAPNNDRLGTEYPPLRSGSTGCFFAQFGWGPCDFSGRPDPCHLIPQQRIKEVFERRGLPCPDLDDERLIVDGCRHHHDLFDRKLRKLKLEQYPPKFLAWTQQHDFFFVDEREGWRGAHVAPTEAAA